jgi:poly-gamma-glutamate synthesis protein (capsule biosynthesis protein)
MNSNFDTKGFLFVLKTLFLLVLLFSGVKYLPDLVYNNSSLKNPLISNSEKALWAEQMTATVVLAREDTEVIPVINLAFVGDIMLDRGVLYKINKVGGGDYDFIFENIKKDLIGYDFLVGNLEGPVSDKGYDGQDLYSFRMDPQIIDLLKGLKFKVLSVANNHINNWRTVALEDTFSRLSEADVLYPGGGMTEEEAYSAKILNIEDTKIAFLSFSEFGKGDYEAIGEKSGIAMISEEKLKSSIEVARENADLVVAMFHFGTEYQVEPNNYQEKYARLAVDFGADLVVGTHPHVVQTLEKYKNTYIAYSLGNFVFDQYFSVETMTGGLLDVKISEKKISSVDLRTIKLNKDYQPELI